MARKLKLDHVPASAQLAEHQIVDPGTAKTKYSKNIETQRSAYCKVSPLKPGGSQLGKGPPIRSRLTVRSAAVTEVCESATESRKTTYPGLSAQEQKLAAEISVINEQLKRRV